jgi:ketosteroid isomerase-like protein
MESQSGSGPLEIVKSFWKALERRGFEAILARVDEDVVWITRDGVTVNGREELGAHLAELRGQEISFEPRAYGFEERGPWVIVAGGLRTRGPGGLQDAQRHWLYRVRGGLIVHMESFSSRDEALRAIELQAA